MLASMLIMAITTSNSMSVKAADFASGNLKLFIKSLYNNINYLQGIFSFNNFDVLD